MQAQDRRSDFQSDTSRQPAVFIGHGSPMVAIEFDEWNEQLCDFIEANPQPAAIVIMSAHWETDHGVKITASRMPEQIYDFEEDEYPDTLFQLTYPCEGQPQLASDVEKMLNGRGIKAEKTEERGLDSGVWVPMYVAFPNMDVPVVEISVPTSQSAQVIYQIGKTLSPLRERGVLLIGSGNLSNNKHYADLENKYAETDDWAIDFDEWFAKNLDEFDIQNLLNYKEHAPHLEKAVDNEAHIQPVFFVLGAMQQSDHHVNLFEGFHYGNISMRSFALASNK